MPLALNILTLAFCHRFDTLSADFYFFPVNSFFLNIYILFSFCGNIGMAASLAGSCSSAANLTCSAHKDRIK